MVRYKCWPPQFELLTPLRWKIKQNWRTSSVKGILNPCSYVASISRHWRKPGATWRCVAGHRFWATAFCVLPMTLNSIGAGAYVGASALLISYHTSCRLDETVAPLGICYQEVFISWSLTRYICRLCNTLPQGQSIPYVSS